MTVAPTFAVPHAFLGARLGDRRAALCIAGIPLDLGTTNRAGSRDGPRAIRSAARMLTDGCHPELGVDPARLDLSDLGEFTIALGDLAASLTQIEAQAEGLAHLLALGGEHTITLALLRALRRRLGVPLGLIQFDAHTDTAPANFGQTLAHGTVFRHAIVEGLVDPRRMIQIGIRAPVWPDHLAWTKAQGVVMIPARTVHEIGPAAVVERVRGVVGGGPTYLSFDIDCLDPAFAPATGTPEMGGLASWQVRAIFRGFSGIDFRGADVVEVAPAYDVGEITALAAATIAWEYLCLHGARALCLPQAGGEEG